MTKTIDDLIQAIMERPVTKESAEEFRQRAEERDKRYQEQSRKESATNEFMARSYNL